MSPLGMGAMIAANTALGFAGAVGGHIIKGHDLFGKDAGKYWKDIGISTLIGASIGIIGGARAMIIGANEIVDGITGTNYIQEWTGWSDDLYNGLYIGSNIVSSVGTIAGNIYMKYNPPYPGRNPNKIPDGFNNRVNEHANYYNPKTDQSLHPDLSHPEPYGPHWDWKDSNGQWWRLYRFWRKIK